MFAFSSQVLPILVMSLFFLCSPLSSRVILSEAQDLDLSMAPPKQGLLKSATMRLLFVATLR